MFLSRERQDYHLTPKGWIEGPFKGNAFGSIQEVEIVRDTFNP